MSKSQADAPTLLGVLIAGAFVGRLWPAAGGWTVAIAGLVLLTILFAYDREGDRTLWQSIAFGAVCGFCLVHVCFPLLLRLRVTQPGWTFYTPNGVGTPVAEGAPLDWPAMIWLAGGVIFTIVDRARMSARQVPPGRAMFEPIPRTVSALG